MQVMKIDASTRTSEAKESRGERVPEVRMTERAHLLTSAKATAGFRLHRHMRTVHWSCPPSDDLAAIRPEQHMLILTRRLAAVLYLESAYI